MSLYAIVQLYASARLFARDAVHQSTFGHDVLDEFRQYPDDIPAYIRLNVEVKDYLTSGANDMARTVADGKKCTFVIKHYQSRCDPINESGTTNQGHPAFVIEPYTVKARIRSGASPSRYPGMASDGELACRSSSGWPD